MSQIELVEWLLQDSNISRYRIHKDTGIPQSTLSDLKNQKTDIEKTSFATGLKLAEYALEKKSSLK